MTYHAQRLKLPTELELCHNDQTFLVRFDYDRGEDQWFDARAGVGSPGYDPFVEITEVNFGQGWESPDKFPIEDVKRWEDIILDKLADIEADQGM